MPARVNTPGDIGTAKIASDSYDVDNIFLTDEGWVYRHYKNSALTKFWDEIIVAGEVDAAATINGVANAPVDALNDATPTFESGDSIKDVEYSPNFRSGGGGTPPAPTIGTITITGASSTTDGNTESYSATNGGTATTGVSYSIASSDNRDSAFGMSVTFNGAGARTLTVTGTSATASDSPATATKSVTVS